MQRKYQAQVLPVLGASLTHLNAGCERLQRLSVSALVNMCNEHCDVTMFLTFSKPLLEGKSINQKAMQEQCSCNYHCAL